MPDNYLAKRKLVNKICYLSKQIETYEQMIRSMQNALVSISDNKKGLLIISCNTTSASLSADIANTYVKHLKNYLAENTATESQRNRIFIEKQYRKLKVGKTSLLEAIEYVDMNFDIEHMVANILNSNINSFKFFQNLGFEQYKDYGHYKELRLKLSILDYTKSVL